MKSFTSLLTQAKKDNIYSLNVAAIILNQKHKILLCQRALYKKVAPGIWHIPGGKLEEGETITRAITRELSEELHVETMNVHSFSGITHDYIHDKKMHRTVFMLVQAKGEIILNKENSDYAFVSFEDLEKYVQADALTRIRANLLYAINANHYSDVQ